MEKSMEDTDAILLYPSQGRSHLVPMVELAKLILTYHPSFSVIVIVSEAPYETGSTAPYIAAVSSSTPSITFYHLPTVPVPSDKTSSSIMDIKTLSFEWHTINNPNYREALISISRSVNIKAVIMDFFCNYSFDVSTGLGIATYYYITGGLAGLTAFLYFPTLHRNLTRSFKELDDVLNIPGMPPILAKNMQAPMLDRSRKIYQYFLDTALQMPKSAGIVVNTIKTLEERALKAILNEECTPGEPAPTIYCVGPLVAIDGSDGGGTKHECLAWLDSQPSQSVVFLCFGSLGRFSAKQLKEMAVGLEKSGVRFLWVVRAPPPPDERVAAMAEPSLESLLPEGFLERNKDKGCVLKGWAPQVEVLSHDSVGGFVTHCGWNSMFESLRAGVPMLCWALFAEQNISQLAIEEELRVGLGLRKGEDGSVSAAELQIGLTELMNSERGNAIRDRVMELRKEVLEAYSEGGPSHADLAQLAEVIRRG